MSFDTTARQRLATGAEEQEMPACLPMVSFTGDDGVDMTDQEIEKELLAMWAEMRKDDRMVVDAPAYKLGMPWVTPYEGVSFHVENDGVCLHVSIPVEQVVRFAAALIHLIPESIKLDAACDAEISAHEAIEKAQGK